MAAAAMAASTALPPFQSMRRPACAASGCEVDTTLRAKTGMRVAQARQLVLHVGVGQRFVGGLVDRATMSAGKPFGP
jgi:hypothetical protein